MPILVVLVPQLRGVVAVVKMNLILMLRVKPSKPTISATSVKKQMKYHPKSNSRKYCKKWERTLVGWNVIRILKVHFVRAKNYMPSSSSQLRKHIVRRTPFYFLYIALCNRKASNIVLKLASQP